MSFCLVLLLGLEVDHYGKPVDVTGVNIECPSGLEVWPTAEASGRSDKYAGLRRGVFDSLTSKSVLKDETEFDLSVKEEKTDQGRRVYGDGLYYFSRWKGAHSEFLTRRKVFPGDMRHSTG